MMAKKTKSRRKPIKPKSVGTVKEKRLSRVDWGVRALTEKGGAIDYGKKAKTILPLTHENFLPWDAGGHKKYDLAGYDHPRPDVKKIPKTYHKYAGAPKSRISKTSKMAGKVLRNNFTAKERKNIGKVFIEGSAPKAGNAAGTNTYYPSDKINIINIHPQYGGDEAVYTHELVHARRHGTTGRVEDHNRDEKETEFETVGRLSSSKSATAGYYQYIKGGNIREDISHDKILLTGSKRKQRKGKRYMADVRKKYSKSKIQNAHFSPAENLDRYFQIILPNGKKVEVHRRYKPNVFPNKPRLFPENENALKSKLKSPVLSLTKIMKYRYNP